MVKKKRYATTAEVQWRVVFISTMMVPSVVPPRLRDIGVGISEDVGQRNVCIWYRAEVVRRVGYCSSNSSNYCGVDVVSEVPGSSRSSSSTVVWWRHT